MSKEEFCFSLDKNKSSIDNTKKFIQDLYLSLGFESPVIIVYDEINNYICVTSKSNSKKNKEKFIEITQNLKKSQLKKGRIILDMPFILDEKIGDEWWNWKNSKKLRSIDVCGRTGDKKWNYELRHNGPYFKDLLEPYVTIKPVVKYGSTKLKLTIEEERVMSYFVNYLISDKEGRTVKQYTKDKVFVENYFTDLKKYLSSENKKIIKNFKSIDFSDFVRKKQKIREEQKNISLKEKKEKNERQKEIEKKYGFAIIDGRKERINGYGVELAGIFIGRGDSVNRGKIKPIIYPCDVTLNLDKSAPIPKFPLSNSNKYKWGNIVNDQCVEWVYKWKDEITGKIKNRAFSHTSVFKGISDYNKFELVKKLKKDERKIKTAYTNFYNDSSNLKNRQLGTVLYLIDKFGIRPGTKNTDKEEETVGATTLKVCNVKLLKNNSIETDFLGKDSVRYNKVWKVDKQIYNNIKSFISGKTKNAQVFDKVTVDSINKFLKQFNDNYTAKLFRTKLGTETFKKELKKIKLGKDDSEDMKKKKFEIAISNVGDVLNHKKMPTIKQQEKIEEMKKEIKLSGKNKNKKLELELLENKGNISSITSKQNYIDPRLMIEWAKNNDVRIEKIMNKNMIDKFRWAMNIK